MTQPVRIALAQLNSHLGNVEANIDRLAKARETAAGQGADMIVTPEMYLSGYPCDDLVLRADFMAAVAAGLDRLTALTADGGPAIVVGAPFADAGHIYNAVFVLEMAVSWPGATRSICQITGCLTTNGTLPPGRCRGR